MDEQFASGLWASEDVERSITARELLAIESALKWFAPLLAGSSVAVFADKSTAVSYLRNQGGTRSSFLNSIGQRILRWAEDLSVVISPQFIMGKHNVLADALSRPNQILGSEWTLKQEVFRDLCRRWPVSIGLFATSQIHSYSLYFSPYHNHNTMETDALLRNWNGWQAYAFPPWSLIPVGLKKLRSSSGVLLTSWLHIGLRGRGFWVFWIWWSKARWLFHSPEIFCVSPTSTGFIWECPGCVFMLGDYQAVHLRRWILQACSSAGVLSTTTVFACRVPV